MTPNDSFDAAELDARLQQYIGISLDNFRDLDAEAREQVLAAVEMKLNEYDRTKLTRYVPNKKQDEFHAAGGETSVYERLLMAGNQLGKCATVSSYLEHPDGTRSTFGEVFAAGAPVPVLSWHGAKAVPVWAVQPIRKPPEPCVRLWFADGSWFECALRHRVLLSSGDYTFASNLLPTILVGDPSTLPPGDGRWWGKLPGFRVGCLSALRSCDALLHHAQGSARAWLRRRGGAPQHSSPSCGLGDPPTTHTSSRRPGSAHPSSQGARGQTWAPISGWLDRVVCTFARYSSSSIREAQRLVLGSLAQPRSGDEAERGQLLQGAFESPGVAGNRIVAYEPIGLHEVFDVTVPRHENYISNGIAHHNTLAAAAEVAMHLTGEYPDWWEGARWDYAPSGWAGSETSQTTRDGVQRLLMGKPGEWGTGMIPGDTIVDIRRAASAVPDTLDSITVRHKSGGLSRLTFKTYDQGRERWQAETLDFVWFDEEPPEGLYFEGKTRTNATGGITFDSAPQFLALPNVPVCGGSWLTPPDAVAAGDWARITQLARAAKALRA